MPIYDYVCADCGHSFEKMHEMTAHSVQKCPSCGSSVVSKLISVPGLIKTGGKPHDGQTCCGRTERCDKPPCSSEGQCHR